MHSIWKAAIAFALATVWSGPVWAQGRIDLDWAAVLARARERGADVRVAQARVDEARGRIALASPLVSTNPSIEATGGPRFQPNDIIVQVEAGVEQTFELGDARGARIAAAQAGLERARAGLDDARRLALAAAAEAFIAALEADARATLAEDEREISERAVAIADRRVRAGDASALDLARARTAQANVLAEAARARALHRESLGALRALLAISPRTPVVLRGELGSSHPAHTPEALRRAAYDRPDLRALQAEIEEAQAEYREAEAARWPLLGVGLGYAFEEGDHMALAMLRITPPIFDDGSGRRAIAQARADRARAELAARRRSIDAVLDAAVDAYTRRVENARALEEARRLAEEQVRLAERAFESGAIGLGDLLLVRRESLEARRAWIDGARELEIARIRLESLAGVLR